MDRCFLEAQDIREPNLLQPNRRTRGLISTRGGKVTEDAFTRGSSSARRQLAGIKQRWIGVRGAPGRRSLATSIRRRDDEGPLGAGPDLDQRVEQLFSAGADRGLVPAVSG